MVMQDIEIEKKLFALNLFGTRYICKIVQKIWISQRFFNILNL